MKKSSAGQQDSNKKELSRWLMAEEAVARDRGYLDLVRAIHSPLVTADVWETIRTHENRRDGSASLLPLGRFLQRALAGPGPYSLMGQKKAKAVLKILAHSDRMVAAIKEMQGATRSANLHWDLALGKAKREWMAKLIEQRVFHRDSSRNLPGSAPDVGPLVECALAVADEPEAFLRMLLAAAQNWFAAGQEAHLVSRDVAGRGRAVFFLRTMTVSFARRYGVVLRRPTLQLGLVYFYDECANYDLNEITRLCPDPRRRR